jgi:hypothetical protein
MLIPVLALLAMLALVGLMTAALIALTKRKKKLKEPDKYRPHECAPGFATVPMLDELCDDLRGGRMVVFRGLICDDCMQRLICLTCGKVPKVGEVIGLPRNKPFRCCSNPDFVLANAETDEEWKSLN